MIEGPLSSSAEKKYMQKRSNLIEINNIEFKYEDIHLNRMCPSIILTYRLIYLIPTLYSISIHRLFSLLNIFEIRGCLRYDDAIIS